MSPESARRIAPESATESATETASAITPKITVFGAGAIGCAVGARWAAAGLDVRFLGRPRLAAQAARRGLTITDLEGRAVHLPPEAARIETDPAAALAEADLVAVTVRGVDTAAAAAAIAAHAPPGAAMLSLQNGVENAARLAAGAPGRPALPGMVFFNMVEIGEAAWRQTTGGAVWAARAAPTQALAAHLSGGPHALKLADDMTPILWGKLLLNLNNAVNALSGETLRATLLQRRWRLRLADAVEEGLAALKAAGLRPARVGALPPALLPAMLRSPDWFFAAVALRAQRIDPTAR
ncbi:MAG: 2-dehydropantoate 2-reductase N-terminal domain-containing protein, partial [Pseudomonadota bacterium]